ncbi:MAG TPA: MFS transporter, partial [Ktedonobacteraceae bacterium]|nr:MFS transporter [Ktedonobacteraceae bacterium]
MVPTSASSKLSAKYSLLMNRNFVLLWLGHTISVLGDTIFNLTLILWVAVILAPRQPWAPLAVSGIMMAATLPYVIVGPLAGVFVDRWDKRRTMLAMDIMRGLLILFLLPMSGVPHLPFLPAGAIAPGTKLGITCVVVFLASTCTQFFTPARVALTGDLVEEPQRVQASSLEQITQSLTMIVGPLLAPPLLLAFGLQWALLINALSFLLSWCTMMLIRTPANTRNKQLKQAGSPGKEFKDGLGFSFGHRVMRALITTMLIGMLGVGAFNELYVFFFLQNLHAPASAIGVVDAIFGVGIVLGAICTGLFTRYLSLEGVLVCAGMIAGGAFVALACTTNMIAALFF